MKTNREIISDLLEENPMYRERKNRYRLIERITGIDAETCKLICSIADEYRHNPLTKADEVGLEMAESWKRSPELAQTESDWDKTFNNMFNQHPLA